MYIHRIAEELLNNKLKNPKVVIILGARQVGKTTLVNHVLKNKHTLFLNMDIGVDKQRLLSLASLSPKDAFNTLNNPEFLIIDEAQRVPETGRIVKGWYDASTNTKIVLLGSSSLDLLNQTAESLTGRNEKLFLPQLMFREVLELQEWYSLELSDKHITTHFPEQVHEALMQNIVFGSYPESILTPNKQQFLLNLASDYLLKDVLQIGLVKTPDTLQRLLMLLAHQVGSEVSIHELALSLGIARATVERYLSLLEQTFVIFRLRSFSTNPRKEITKSHKIYFWDTGIRNAILNEFSLNTHRSDIGALWENWVIAEYVKNNFLRGTTRNLFFWRSRIGGEVDLVVKEGEKICAYEIKWKKQSYRQTAFAEKYRTPVKLVDASMPLLDFNSL